LNKPVRALGPSAQSLLRRYPFPGNVRELSNVIERAVLFSSDTTLEATHFPPDIQDHPVSTGKHQDTPSSVTGRADSETVRIDFRVGEQTLTDLEDRIITEVLKRCEGNKTLAAKHLGITRWKLDRRRKT
ncbi:sigma-54-dependent Fis family transcriptional regulator, partial [Nitrospirales bacterium NOB]|nr:sigma-54-dependent Fis family transcriptional regulator [Nitrospirales bacterium NOB]